MTCLIRVRGEPWPIDGRVCRRAESHARGVRETEDLMTAPDAQQCALKIRQLAADPRFEGRAEDLNSLAADLAAADGDSWAGTDLFAAFPPASALRLERKNTAEQVVGALAGVSVFLPVAWTWWSFHSASEAYEQLLSDSGEPEGTTFLAMWATGFDGRLDGLHRLVPMGMVSLSLILFAILSVVTHRLLAGRNVRGEDQEAQKARLELASALSQAQRILNARRADHPARIEGIIKSSMEELRRAHETTGHLITQLSTTAEKVESGLTEMLATVETARNELVVILEKSREANETLSAATASTEAAISACIASLDDAVTRAIAEANRAMTGVTNQTEVAVTGSISTLDESLSRAIRDAESSLTSSAEQLRIGLLDSTARFEQSLGARVDELKDATVAEVTNAGSSLRRVVDSIGESADTNAAAARELTEKIGVMADDNAVTREELIRTLEEMRGTLDGIEGGLDRHESVLQGHASDLSGARDAAERLLRRITIPTSGEGSAEKPYAMNGN